MDKDLKLILNYLNEKRGFDFSGYRTGMAERLVGQRMQSAKCENYNSYLHFLRNAPDEIDNLLEAMTINVSRFFRDTLTYEYIAEKVLSTMIYQKKGTADPSLRVWSAGCSMGEEPFSIAILIHELLEKEPLKLDTNIFATDINVEIIKKAKKATYPLESIKDVKYRLLEKYFASKGKLFQLIPEIRNLVSFSAYDLRDEKSYAPPESVFGSFDIVFCRNVLIYFDTEFQDLVFDKLYRSLSEKGYLVLGESEIPSKKYQKRFRKVIECCHIYQKC